MKNYYDDSMRMDEIDKQEFTGFPAEVNLSRNE